MSTPSAAPKCVICEGPLAPGEQRCPHCQSSPAWRDLAEAIDFADRRLRDWQQEGSITADQHRRLQEQYQRQRQETVDAARQGQAFPVGTGLPPGDQCWNCHADALGEDGNCEECRVPMTGPGVRSLRSWKFLEREVKKHEAACQLSLYQSHEFQRRIKGAMGALRSRLGHDRPRERSREATEGAHERSARKRKDIPRRSLLETLLDPQSIQWLLGSGGVLLAIGLVIWLTSLGLLDNPGVVAFVMAAGNGLLLVGGWATIRYTRYQVAGRSLTLLACLIMPLNLWFYHAHDLITLQGHLWIAALLCCCLYAASATVLRDPLFVYVLCGGLALTGLLFLGDFGKLDQIFAPSAMLVFLGLLALHAERAFPEGDGPFTRKSFGLAFFWSAQGLLGAGLLLLLGAQLIGLIPRAFALGARPEVAELAALPKTLLLVLAGTYAYVYSDLVVRRIGVYIYLAAFTLLWAEIQLLVLLNLTNVEPVVLGVLAFTGLGANLLCVVMGKDVKFMRPVPALALFLSLVPVVFGVFLHFRATNSGLHRLWPYEINPGHVAALLVTALCARAGAYFHRHTMPVLSATYFFATAAATLVFAAGLAWLLGFKPWETQAPFLMLIPIAYLVAAHLYKGHTPEEPLVWCAHASAAVMLVSSLWTALEVTPQVVQPITGKALNLLIMAVCAEAALFYGLAAALRKESWNIYLATAMLCGALWQLLIFLNTPDEYYTLAFALAGTALLIAYRLSLLESTRWRFLSQAAFQSANVLLSLAFLSGGLLTLTRLLMTDQALANLGGGDWKSPVRFLIFLLTVLLGLSLVAAWLVNHADWRRWYIVLTFVNGAALLLALHRLSLLSPWQQLELFSIVIGAALLLAGHFAWYREQGKEEENEMVGFCLLFGGLLVAFPLLTAVIVYRFGFTISGINEFGLVLASVVLFGSGVMCRLKTTTLIGAISLALYLLLVLAYMHRFLKDQVIVGIYLTLGGVLLFGTGLLLSLYRDRLLELPLKIKRREGVFKILNWR